MARRRVRTGLGAAAILGVGALLIAPPGTSGPEPVSAEVQLASVESVLGDSAPLSPAGQIDPWWWMEGERLFGDSARPTNPASASASPGGLLNADRCGLICNGADGSAPGEDGQGGAGGGGTGGTGGSASGGTGGTGGTGGPA
ncbi:MAG: hypothetical protein V3U55_03990 [Mycobacterium sp.]